MFYNSLKILHIKCATLYFSYRAGLLCKEEYIKERQPLEEAIEKLLAKTYLPYVNLQFDNNSYM